MEPQQVDRDVFGERCSDARRSFVAAACADAAQAFSFPLGQLTDAEDPLAEWPTVQRELRRLAKLRGFGLRTKLQADQVLIAAKPLAGETK